MVVVLVVVVECVKVVVPAWSVVVVECVKVVVLPVAWSVFELEIVQVHFKLRIT